MKPTGRRFVRIALLEHTVILQAPLLVWIVRRVPIKVFPAVLNASIARRERIRLIPERVPVCLARQGITTHRPELLNVCLVLPEHFPTCRVPFLVTTVHRVPRSLQPDKRNVRPVHPEVIPMLQV